MTSFLGCAFYHTAIRENYMTSQIASELEPQGIIGANGAMGIYVYGAPNLPFGSEFPPACIVETTLGDRRLGTHVMSGIELLLPLLLDMESLDEAILQRAFPSRRVELGGILNIGRESVRL